MPIPKPTFREVPLAQVEADPKYVQRERPVKDRLLLESIERYGIMAPIHVQVLADNSFKIIDGHRRYECAKLLVFETVPCLVHEQLSEGNDAYLQYVLNDVKPWSKAETERALRRLRDMRHPDYEEIRKSVNLIQLEGEE